jgi:thiol peroxidase
MALATASRSSERQGVVTFKGNPLTLIGPELKPGDTVPDCRVLRQDLAPVKLSDAPGTIRLISAVPSLDTPVCDAQTRRFNEEAATLPSGVEIWTVSMDLPFAQKRWCGAAGIDRVQVLSDHQEASFGLAFGTLIKELRLLARAVFVIDQHGIVRHAEYVREVTMHPDYDAALSAVRQLAK